MRLPMELSYSLCGSRQLHRYGLKIARCPDIHIVTPRIMGSNHHLDESRQLRRSGLKIARCPDIHIVTPRIMGSNHHFDESRQLRRSGLKIARCPHVRIVTLSTTESVLCCHGNLKLLRGSVESLQFPVLPSTMQPIRGCSHPRFLCSRPH